MNSLKIFRYAVVTGLFSTVLVFADPQKASPAPKEPAKVETLKLRISNDGKGIVDQRGREIARFNKDFRIDIRKEGKAKGMHAQGAQVQLQGCMRCRDECIRYDSNGRCIQTYRSCTWDFDCK